MWWLTKAIWDFSEIPRNTAKPRLALTLRFQLSGIQHCTALLFLDFLHSSLFNLAIFLGVSFALGKHENFFLYSQRFNFKQFSCFSSFFLNWHFSNFSFDKNAHLFQTRSAKIWTKNNSIKKRKIRIGRIGYITDIDGEVIDSKCIYGVWSRS